MAAAAATTVTTTANCYKYPMLMLLAAVACTTPAQLGGTTVQGEYPRNIAAAVTMVWDPWVGPLRVSVHVLCCAVLRRLVQSGRVCACGPSTGCCARAVDPSRAVEAPACFDGETC